METHCVDGKFVITGLGYCVLAGEGCTDSMQHDLIRLEHSLNIMPWLKTPKNFKFMGKQDQLAVIAAGRALTQANVPETRLKDRTGLFMVIGYIPFERAEIDALVNNSREGDTFSMPLFSTQGIDEVNPLLTFRCLPNMPAFHTSLNFAIQGTYYTSYPDAGQMYVALEQAMQALLSDEIDIALIGGVADQNNFLVQHHLDRLPVPNNRPDIASFMCLEKSSFANKRDAMVLAELCHLATRYTVTDPLIQITKHGECVRLNGEKQSLTQSSYFGPASLPLALSVYSQKRVQGELSHRITSCGNITGSSQWLMGQST